MDHFNSIHQRFIVLFLDLHSITKLKLQYDAINFCHIAADITLSFCYTMLSLLDSSCHISDFTVASGSIAISTTDVDVKWNKLQAEVCYYLICKMEMAQQCHQRIGSTSADDNDLDSPGFRLRTTEEDVSSSIWDIISLSLCLGSIFFEEVCGKSHA